MGSVTLLIGFAINNLFVGGVGFLSQQYGMCQKQVRSSAHNSSGRSSNLTLTIFNYFTFPLALELNFCYLLEHRCPTMLLC